MSGPADGSADDRVVNWADERVDHQQWGEEFFVAAISEERVVGAVGLVAGRRIELGPIGVGPGRIAKARAEGTLRQASATRLPPARTGGLVGYRVVLPIELTFEIDLQVETSSFDARLLVPLTVTAVPLSGVRIWIDLTPPEGKEVHVEVRADGLRASVLQKVVGLEDELRGFVATYVAQELEKPHVRAARMIDVPRAMDAAWTAIGPDQGSSSAASIPRTEQDQSA